MSNMIIGLWFGFIIGCAVNLAVMIGPDAMLPNGVSVEQLIDRGALAYCQNDGKLTYVGECE